MKTFLKCAFLIKSYACILFTAFMLVLAVVHGMILDWPITGALILEVMLLCLLCSLVQMVFFSGMVLKKMTYPCRLICSLPAFLAVVVGAGVIFRWFSIHLWQAWAIFLAIFAGIFVVIAVAFEVYFYLTGQKYNDLLQRYKEREET